MKQFFLDLKKYYKYIIYSGKATLKSDVAESHLSWLWWILDPLLFMLVYTFVHSLVFGSSEKYLAAFIFIGLNNYKFFESNVKGAVKIVSRNKPIISKVYVPKYILLFTDMYVSAFHLAVSYSLVVISMVLYQVPVTYHIVFFIPLLLLLMLISFGFSTIMLHFGVYVQDLQNVITVLLRLMFYMSGVFYSIPNRLSGQPVVRDVLLKCNPLAFIIDQTRNSLLYGTDIDWGIYFAWFGVSILLILLGLRLIRKNENSYVKIM